MKSNIMLPLLLTASAAFAATSCFHTGSRAPKEDTATSKYMQDSIEGDDGSEIVFTYYGHASIAIEALGHRICIDPVGEKVDWAAEPPADLVLITHSHFDHLDTNVVKILTGRADGYCKMSPGETAEPFDRVSVRAVPAYNVSPDQLDFHPRERGDVGYIISTCGRNIYVSGDTEDNEDVLAIRDIDVAFICCNKPYTMSVEQCARTVRAIRPKVFIPYHFGGTQTPTDTEALRDSVKDITDVWLRPLE